MNLTVSPLEGPSPAQLAIEVVERKGLGHPDTVCDAIAERLSTALSRFYLDRFGCILHHNVDKGLLWGGAALSAFGGGRLLEPIELFLAGRATAQFKGVAVPLEELAVESTRAWLKENLPLLDPQRDVRIHACLRPTSADLTSLFVQEQGSRAPLANDTSIGVGFAPLDALESAVLAVEKRLNAKETKSEHPAIGTDIKVMGLRQGEAMRLTIACALIDRYVASLDEYFVSKETVKLLARAAVARRCEVEVNTADGESEGTIYLTVTGTSAEAGDDGEVGRGNRVNGLITPYRPMSMEAVAGKNPVTHVGKLYNILAQRVAAAIVSRLDGIGDAQCFLLSQIGRPIDQPQIADVRVRPREPGALEPLRPHIAHIVHEHLEQVGVLWRDAITNSSPLW